MLENIMINLLDIAESPAALPATVESATADKLMNHKMEHMFQALLSRASYPVFFGRCRC